MVVPKPAETHRAGSYCRSSLTAGKVSFRSRWKPLKIKL